MYLVDKNKDFQLLVLLAKKPKIFIFDDSFSALDLKTDAKLRKAIKIKN